MNTRDGTANARPGRSGKVSAAIALGSLAVFLAVAAISVWVLMRPKPGPLENLHDDGLLQTTALGAVSYPPGDLERLPDDAAVQGAGPIAADEKISPATRFRLGETKRIGNLDVTAVAVEDCELATYKKDEPDSKIETGPVLVLRLHVKNVSEKQTFHPLDPAFLYPDPKKQMKTNDLFDGRGLTYTYLQTADRAGKVILPYDLKWQERAIEGQDFPKLEPGGKADLIVVSDMDSPEKVKSPMVWRVKLRKGLTATGQGVATVIGVAFDPSQIKRAEKKG